MALNYGLGENFTTLVPILNDCCIFQAPTKSITGQYPDPPGHAKRYISSSVLSSDSVIHFLNHSFNTELPTTDNIIEYHIEMHSSAGASGFEDKKVLEFVPVKSPGTTYNYVIDLKIRVGDYFTHHEINNSTCFSFAVSRKSGTGSMGGGSNMMYYLVMSPFRLFL